LGVSERAILAFKQGDLSEWNPHDLGTVGKGALRKKAHRLPTRPRFDSGDPQQQKSNGAVGRNSAGGDFCSARATTCSG